VSLAEGVGTLWTCPTCHRRFANRNQWHACSTIGLDEQLAGKSPEAVAIFRRFADEVRRCGPVSIIPERTRIAFATRMSFASVVLRKRWVDAGLVFGRRPRSSRFHRVETFSPRNHVGTLRLETPEQVDGQVGRWIGEAYLVGLQRHIRPIDPPPIRAPRLDLVTMSPELMVAILRGDWDWAARIAGVAIPDEWTTEDWSWHRVRLEQVADDPAVLPWLARLMILRGDRQEIVGNAGFHGPPDRAGMAELGYHVVGRRRRMGFATETVVALMEWARSEHAVHRFRASIGPWNQPSLGLARKLGFQQTGVQWDDEDGEELVFELDPGAVADGEPSKVVSPGRARARPGHPARSPTPARGRRPGPR